jgi:histidinol-phosphate aminotransferase
LRLAIGRAHGLAPEQVMVGNGSDEVLLMIALAFLRPGDRVLLSENTFSEYEFSGRALDAEIVKIPLRGLRYDLNGFSAALARKPKLIFLCNPNNPTGTYFRHAELEALLRRAPRRCLVVLDEAYGEYATARDFPRSLELMHRHPNLLVARTFSKLYGMAGLRLGCGMGDAALIRETYRVKTPFNVNRLAQAAALEALRDRSFVRRSLSVNRSGKIQLEKGLGKLGLRFLPTQANFICFECAPGQTAAETCEKLMRRGAIIRALGSFGLPQWCRVTVGTKDQNRFFLRELERVL